MSPPWRLTSLLLGVGLLAAVQLGPPAVAQSATGPQPAGPSALGAPVAQEPPVPPAEAGQDPAGEQEGRGLLPTAMSDEEEQALRLVEEILQEQHMILAGQNFVYRAEGRRDPFRNILSLRRRELVAPVERPAGLAGFLVGEVEPKATALVRGQWHVLLLGLDQRTYTAEVGTRLYDATIVAISENEVVFEQEVEDMLGARSTRQVVKKLDKQDEG